jgi:sugar phosphate isomerase/epimerase
MQLCLHMTTSASAGYRAALEGWARAGITLVELDATVLDTFLETDTLEGARRVLVDNGLSAVHAAVGVSGLLEPGHGHGTAIERLAGRLDQFAALGVTKVYTPAVGTRRLAIEQYRMVAENIRRAGELARSFGMVFSVEFVRTSPFMSTLPTALRLVRQAAHPDVGLVLDCYHLWSGLNRMEDLEDIRPGEIRHVHFQDVPDLPRELLDSDSRVIAGDGVAPLDVTLRALAATGYDGPLSVELFLPEFRDRDPFEMAREIRHKSEAVMRRAGVLAT